MSTSHNSSVAWLQWRHQWQPWGRKQFCSGRGTVKDIHELAWSPTNFWKKSLSNKDAFNAFLKKEKEKSSPSVLWSNWLHYLVYLILWLSFFFLHNQIYANCLKTVKSFSFCYKCIQRTISGTGVRNQVDHMEGGSSSNTLVLGYLKCQNQHLELCT